VSLSLLLPPEFTSHKNRLDESTVIALAEKVQTSDRDIEIDVQSFAKFLLDHKNLLQSDPEASYLAVKALVFSGNLDAAIRWEHHRDHPGIMGFRALALMFAGKSENAGKLFNKALEWLKESGGTALVLEVLGLYMFFQTATRRREEALETFYQAMEIFNAHKSSETENVIPWVLTRGAYALRAKGLLDAAHKLNNEALAYADHSGNRLLQALSLLGIGMCFGSSRNSKQAIDQYERALDLLDEIGADTFKPMILNRLGMAMGSQGRMDKAERIFEESVRIARTSGAFWLEFGPLGNLAGIRAGQGDLEGALKAYVYCRDSAISFGDLQDAMWFSITIGNIYQKLGQMSKARQSYQKAKELAVKLGLAIIFQEQGNDVNSTDLGKSL
jgi:tetratricopeptide (TPR) repeat protein